MGAIYYTVYCYTVLYDIRILVRLYSTIQASDNSSSLVYKYDGSSKYDDSLYLVCLTLKTLPAWAQLG